LPTTSPITTTPKNYVRIRENLGRLRPRLWPVLLNICGYVLPVIILLRRRIQPVRFANYLYILPLWLAVMFYTGVILETRIYGELIPITVVASLLLIESHLVRVTEFRLEHEHRNTRLNAEPFRDPDYVLREHHHPPAA
jgi:hypothetical protein